MANPAKVGSRKYKQGKFVPQNPEKYIGKKGDEIIYRSSWEHRICKWFDQNSSVLYWNSEGFIVPYLSPVDHKMHRYYVDFVAQIKNRSGEIKTYAIEVKPAAQMDVPTTKNRKRLLEETLTFSVNQAKWNAAKEFFAKKNVQFIVLNEYDLGIK